MSGGRDARVARSGLGCEPGDRAGRPGDAVVRQRQRRRPRREPDGHQAERRRRMRSCGRRTSSRSISTTGEPVDDGASAIVGHADPPGALPGVSGDRRDRPHAFAGPPRRGRRPAGPIPPFGTTHADHFHGAVPVTRQLSDQEVAGDYEAATGAVIVEALTAAGLDAVEMPAVLVASHGPFTWGPDAAAAADNAIALEAVAAMAIETLALDPNAKPVARVAARPPLPPQARGDGLLRAAPVTAVREPSAPPRSRGCTGRATSGSPARRSSTPGPGEVLAPGHGRRAVRLGPALVSPRPGSATRAWSVRSCSATSSAA